MNRFPKQAQDEVPLREFLERLIDERDKRLESVVNERDKQYDMRFRASEIAVNAALAAQEKAVTAAFLASEKAIVKAEEAQKDYNVRSNEFRGQLDDQAKTLIPRIEASVLIRALEEKMAVVQGNLERGADINLQAIADVRLALSHMLSLDVYETRHTELQRQVNELREARSAVEGKSSGASTLWGYFVAAVGAFVGIFGIVLALVYHFGK